MRERKELIAAAGELVAIFKQFKERNIVTISMEEKVLLKEVYTQIYPGVQMNLGCSGCCKNYLQFLTAWYEREKPAFDAEQIKATAVAPQPQAPSTTTTENDTRNKKASPRTKK